MKKTTVTCAMLLLSLVFYSCGNKTQNSSANNKVNPIWGMWLQQEPATEAKREIMFNDDFTGFVFVADTLQYTLQWSQDENLKIKYKNPLDGNAFVNELLFNVTLSQDTLMLETDDVQGQSEKKFYLRVRM